MASNFIKALKKHFVYKTITRPTTEQLDNALKDSIVVMRCCFGLDWPTKPPYRRHLLVITKSTKDFYWVTNVKYGKGKSHQRISKRWFHFLYMQQLGRKKKYPKIWTING
jgi:hypothetical protein